VLAKVTKILGENNISIAAFNQKEEAGEFVPVVIITHQALEGEMSKALSECSKLDMVRPEPTLIRIADI
jgi:homoserine dehydrogenase